MSPLNHKNKSYKVIAVKGKPPYGTLLAQTAPGKGRIIELGLDTTFCLSWTFEAISIKVER